MPLRLLLGRMDALLRDMLQRLAADRDDIEMVDGDPDAATGPELGEAVRRFGADAVIVEIEQLPQVPDEVLDLWPDLLVVGIARDGARIALGFAPDGQKAAIHAHDLGAGLLEAVESVAAAVRRQRDADRPIRGRRVVRLHPGPEGGEAPSRGAGDEDAYAGDWEYLSDELARLDLLLCARVQEGPDRLVDADLEGLQGLVISRSAILASLGEREAENPDDGELRQIRAGIDALDVRIRKRTAASLQRGIALALPEICARFHLGEFEGRCLLLALAPEIDPKYEKVYAFLQDDVTRRQPSVELALRVFCEDVDERIAQRRAFSPGAALVRHELLRVEGGALLGRSLELDAGVAQRLLGTHAVDPRIRGIATLHPPQESPQLPVREELCERLRAFLEPFLVDPARSERDVVLHLHGRPGSGRRSLVTAAARAFSLAVLRVDLARALDSGRPFEELVRLVARQAALGPYLLAFEGFDRLLESDEQSAQLRALADAIRQFSRITFLIGSRPWSPGGLLGDAAYLDCPLPPPDADERGRIWREELGRVGWRLGEPEVDQLAAGFRLTPGQIRSAARLACDLAAWDADSDPAKRALFLQKGARDQSSSRLGGLALHIEPRRRFDELVLPEDQLEQLRELARQVEHAHQVMVEWGFRERLTLGGGVTALFAGPSGTGKTLAAECIAQRLGLDVAKINLAGVVSKYVGETEKNLDRIFTEAEYANVVLLFDEADALFGRRSEVRDAHDRYANIEVAYLLQKMEEYSGLAILATNLKKNMDEAFVRRIRFIVDFPFPDDEHRERIWRGAFPERTPVAADVDFAFLARRLALTGGNIRNICLRAAFLAAGEGRPRVGMRHVLAAASREFEKLGRQYPEEAQSAMAVH